MPTNSLRRFALVFLVAMLPGCVVGKRSGSSGDGGAGGGGGSGTGGNTADGGGGTDVVSCDDANACGNTQSGCIGCAVNGPCAAALYACESSIECADFEICLGTCDGIGSCIDICLTTYSDGANLYINAASCVYCSECYGSCNGANSGC